MLICPYKHFSNGSWMDQAHGALSLFGFNESATLGSTVKSKKILAKSILLYTLVCKTFCCGKNLIT